MSKQILVTGASGLLGRAVCVEFMKHNDWEVTGLAFSRSRTGLDKVDLTDEAAVKSIMDKIKPNVVIHCAAERRPDVVDNKPEATQALNVSATQSVCQHAKSVGAVVIYMSTDYVFDGKSPPYKVTDVPNPLNEYGKTKHQGEIVTLENNPGNIILRVPILYGDVEYEKESAVTFILSQVRVTADKHMQDNIARRFPTHTGDVALVLYDLITKRLQDDSLIGIFHWSDDQNMTKYDIAMIMGESLGISTDHICQNNTPPPSGAPRPLNAQLDCTRILDLGICHRRPFREAIKNALQRFV